MTDGLPDRQNCESNTVSKNGGLDQYSAGPFEQQQSGTAGVEGLKRVPRSFLCPQHYHLHGASLTLEKQQAKCHHRSVPKRPASTARCHYHRSPAHNAWCHSCWVTDSCIITVDADTDTDLWTKSEGWHGLEISGSAQLWFRYTTTAHSQWCFKSLIG